MSQSEPRGRISCGEAGFRLRPRPRYARRHRRAYTSAEIRPDAGKSTIYDGPPVLAVEILSPSDTHEEIVEKIGEYLEAGTVVWLVDPDFRNVTVYGPVRRGSFSTPGRNSRGSHHLPGFRGAHGATLRGLMPRHFVPDSARDRPCSTIEHDQDPRGDGKPGQDLVKRACKRYATPTPPKYSGNIRRVVILEILSGNPPLV